MSISDFDVEPAVPFRSWAWVFGALGVVLGLLAVIGWPVPHVAGRVGGQQAWADTVHDARAWLGHDGWRTSGASWVWGAAAAASTCGAVALRLTSASDTRRRVIVVVPAAALLVIGPVAQWALGLPWSNYGGGSSGPHALVLVVVVVLAFAAVGLRRAVRGLGRRIDRRAVRRDLQPGGDDRTPRHRVR